MASIKYKYKFLTELDDSLKCSICLEVAKGLPKQHEVCGKLFCEKCIEMSGNIFCPICRTRSPTYFNDVRGKQDIIALHVRCDNVERGCDWKGTVGLLENHMTKCALTLVPCPLKCKVEDKYLLLKRKELDSHLITKCPNRNHNCKFCGKKGAYAVITEEHDQICKKKIIPCPNTGCGITMERGKTSQHTQTVCDYSVLACKYESIGCSVKKIRKDMMQHEKEDNVSHFHLSLDKFAELDSTATSSKGEITSLKSELTATRNEIASLVKQLNDFQKETEMFKSAVSLDMTSLESLKKEVASLKDTISSMEDTMKDAVLKKEKSITLRVAEFNRKKKRNGTCSSEAFFTSPGGYKICIVVYANGHEDGEGTHVSVYAKILKGPYDDALSWPFTGTIKFELLNQSRDEIHHSLVKECNALANAQVGSTWGHGKFLPHSRLSHWVGNIAYLMNDALCFRVTVKTQQPWLNYTHHIK